MAIWTAPEIIAELDAVRVNVARVLNLLAVSVASALEIGAQEGAVCVRGAVFGPALADI
jgi:hypothetical protein